MLESNVPSFLDVLDQVSVCILQLVGRFSARLIVKQNCEMFKQLDTKADKTGKCKRCGNEKGTVISTSPRNDTL